MRVRALAFFVFLLQRRALPSPPHEHRILPEKDPDSRQSHQQAFHRLRWD